jgi:hypothetical protein
MNHILILEQASRGRKDMNAILCVSKFVSFQRALTWHDLSLEAYYFVSEIHWQENLSSLQQTMSEQNLIFWHNYSGSLP